MVLSSSAESSRLFKAAIPGSSSPITRLPIEVLPLIFFEAVRSSRAKCGTVLTISWVSYLWRTIALSTPELWTWIDTLNLGIIRTFMDRAKNRPLSATLKIMKQDDCMSTGVVLKSLHNLRLLEVSTSWTQARPFSEMSSPAPLLQSLHLDGVYLPPNPFSGSLPSLRHLSLKLQSIDWKKIPECPQLRSLRVTEHEGRISIPEFVKRLHGFSLLERIETNFIFDEDSGAVASPGQLTLRNLKSLIFSLEDATSVVAVLDRIQVSSTCQVIMGINQNDPDQYLGLFTALSTCRVGTPRDIKKLKVLINSSIKISIYEGDFKQRNTHKESQFDEDLGYIIWPPQDWPHPHHPINMTFSICQNNLSLHHLEVVDLMAPDIIAEDYPAESFWEYLETLPNLRVLKVRHVYAESFTDYLSTTLQSADGELPPFSAIRKLVYEDPEAEVDAHTPRLELLVQYLHLRAESGLTLTSLTLVQFGELDSNLGDLPENLAAIVTEPVKRKLRKWYHGKVQLVE